MSSGTKYDSGKAPIHFITREFIEGLAKAQGFGAKKYGDYNFTKGIAYTRLLDAAMRHLIAFTWGENNDSESCESHISHAAANLNMLMFMIKNHPELDDRYKEPNQNLTVFTTEDEINNMIKHKDKFVKTMGEDVYQESLNKLLAHNKFKTETKKHTDAAVQNILDGLNKDLMDAETKRFFGLDKK